jgi:glycosyltransferase involved in cell wall biosynthesis
LHNLHGYYLDFFKLIEFIGKQGVPVIWTLHDEWPITSLLAHSMNCSHCKTGKGKCINTYTYPKTYNKIFLNFTLKKKQKYFSSLEKLTIVCPSKWLAERIKESYLNKSNIVTIYNGIDLNLFKPLTNKEELRKKYNLPVNKKIILFSASNFREKGKGIDYIIKIIERLKKDDISFLIIGNNQIVQKDNIYNFGYIPSQEKMNELYALSDLYIFPSLAETMPLAPLEAMASGLPVVTFNIGPMKEIVTEKEGALVRVGDIEALISATKLILDDDEKRKKISDNARKKIVDNFSLEKMLENYENLYNYHRF